MSGPFRRFVAFALSVSLLVVTASCGGDGGGTDPDPNDAVASVTISPASGQVALGGTLTLVATARNGRNEVVTETITWTSSNDGIATVDASGVVRGIIPGAVTITARAAGRSGTAAIESYDPNPPAAPSDVQAATVSHTEIDIGWTDHSNSETGFVIRREVVGAAPSSGPNASAAQFVEAGTVGPDVVTFRDSGLAPETVYRYTVEACNPVGCSAGVAAAQEPATHPTLTIESPSALADGQVGVAYQATLMSSGPAATWSLVDGAVPGGLTLSAAGVVSGTPTAGGAFSFTAMAQGGGQMVTQAFTLTIIAPPVVTTSTLADGIRGAAYSEALAAVGGDGSYSWTLVAGGLPAGLVLGPAGTISGTPTAAGVASFTVQVASAGLTASANLTLRVLEPLMITTTVLSAGVLNTAYSQTLAATGGDGSFAWSLTSGTLPDGLTLAPNGVVSGIPTTLGTSNFQVAVTSGDGQTTSAALAITINDQVVAPSVTTVALADGGVGAVYTQTLQATDGDGTYTWSITGGALPAGLALTPATGLISGTPNAAGTSNFTVQVTSAGLTATAALTITVQPALSITTTTLPNGVEGAAYAAGLTVSGGDGTNAFSVSTGALPPGLSLDSGTGVISGSPTAAPPAPTPGGPMAIGTSNFTVEVSNGLGQMASQALSISIFLPVAITTSSLGDGAVGAPYSATLAASGGDGSYMWAVVAGALPGGLTLTGTTGSITGTPAAPGTSNFTVEVTTGDGQTATVGLAMTVTSGPPVITTTTLAGGILGVAYNQTIDANGGNGTYAWAVIAGALPDGLTLGPSTGAITGTPTSAATFNFTVEVTSDGQTDTQALSIVVTGAPLAFARSYLPGGYAGTPYSATPSPATGGSGSIAYSITAGALPDGLALNASTGEISGTPTTAGMAFFELTATSGGQTKSVVFGFTISGAAATDFNVFGVNVADVVPSASVQTAINAALARFEAVITADAPALVVPGGGADASCSGNYPLFYGQTIDDVEVIMNIAPIDGPGGTLGQGGLCGYIRAAAPLTATAQLTLDSDDLGGLNASLKFALLWHEIGHGFGISEGVWTLLSLMTGADGPAPEYTGAGGVAQFGGLGGIGNPPIEADGGEGTRDSHWDEGFFDTEMMTGYLDAAGNAISVMTVAALGDLGWGGINLGAADAYSIPGCSPTCSPPAGVSGAGVKIPLLDDVLDEPIFFLAPDGTIRAWRLGGGMP